ncbi:MAG: class II aldolase/adducin family protein, partial [Clostridia bacterium]|nr:class II aldolase/adducin family protein [Clostridia bacterium]
MNAAELYSADVMITIMNRLLRTGMICSGRGMLSVMDERGTLRIVPAGGDCRDLTAASVTDFPSDAVAGDCSPCADDARMHLSVYRACPDLRSIICACPVGLTALCASDRLPDLTLIPGADELCGKICRGCDSADAVVEAFAGGASAVMLNNGNVLVGAPNAFRAFMLLETMAQCAEIELNAAALGTPRMYVSRKHRVRYALEAAPVLKEIELHEPGEDEQGSRELICNFLHRACEDGLASSAYGSCALRLADGGFLITPSDRDRLYLAPQDLIYVKNGACTPGAPSHAVRLIEKIFAEDSACRAVWVAHSPCLSAFNVTEGAANEKLIPDWCDLLKHAPHYPYGANFLQPDMLARAIASDAPFCMIENDCIISAGPS